MCEYVGMKTVGRWISKLQSHTAEVEGGKDWEDMVSVAVALRCVNAQQLEDDHRHRLLAIPEQRPLAHVYCADIPSEFRKPVTALKWWQDTIRQTVVTFPHISVLTPNFQRFEVADCMQIYVSSNTAEPIVRLYQMKAGKKYGDPSKVPESMQWVLMQGDAPASRQGSRQPTRDEVVDFLGASLRDLYPSSSRRSAE
eukprot:SRR837773.15703.p1 GENE.SRR837773.15703~~SRR837773.15703.p1  ORF type:complete len:211 (+),score=27.11 SRR837773.15703:43-633(+)